MRSKVLSYLSCGYCGTGNPVGNNGSDTPSNNSLSEP